MHRVELKAFSWPYEQDNMPVFLMHRVELKVLMHYAVFWTMLVPNVPCGVESHIRTAFNFLDQLVPNVPCGVESFWAYHFLR